MFKVGRILCLLGVAGLSACQAVSELTAPTYAEIRFSHYPSKIEMVTFLKAYGDADCQVATENFVKGFVQDSDEGWTQTHKSCKKELNELYQRIFNNEQIHATYIILSKSGGWDYESRAVLYGVPSSQAQEVCEQVAGDIKRRFKADVECVQGTVG